MSSEDLSYLSCWNPNSTSTAHVKCMEGLSVAVLGALQHSLIIDTVWCWAVTDMRPCRGRVVVDFRRLGGG